MKVAGKFIFRVMLFMAILSGLGFYHFDKLQTFFLTNQTLNTLILSILFIGIIFILRQLFILESEVLNSINVPPLKSIPKLSPLNISNNNDTTIKSDDSKLK